MSTSHGFVGIVLAGGRSTRMGNDKASLSIAGQSMLFRVTSLLQSIPACRTVIVVAAKNQPLPELPAGIRCLHDRSSGLGPLEGFATALAAVNHDQDVIGRCFLTSCDAPFLAATFVTLLVGECPHGIDAAVPVHHAVPQPLSAAYSTGILAVIDELLAQEQRSMRSLLARIRCRYLDADSLREADPELLSLRNLNTPADFHWAVQKASQ